MVFKHTAMNEGQCYYVKSRWRGGEKIPDAPQNAFSLLPSCGEETELAYL